MHQEETRRQAQQFTRTRLQRADYTRYVTPQRNNDMHFGSRHAQDIERFDIGNTLVK